MTVTVPESVRHLLILTSQPEEYRARVEAERLPNLSVVAASDVNDGLARGAHCDLLFGDPARVRAAVPRLPRLAWAQLTWAGVEPMLDPSLRRDYVLTNLRGAFGPLMSEFVFGYLLFHERRMLARLEASVGATWVRPGLLRMVYWSALGVLVLIPLFAVWRNLGAFAATGGPLLLGKSNTASKATTLKTTSKGPALSLKTKKGSAPLKVTSSTKVAKLNADLVDGLDGAALRTGPTPTSCRAR